MKQLIVTKAKVYRLSISSITHAVTIPRVLLTMREDIADKTYSLYFDFETGVITFEPNEDEPEKA